ALPASSHSCAFASDVAGFEAFPGKLIPIASTADAIVLAVYIPPHEPGPGHEQRSMACNCSVEISPLLCCPTPSNTDTKLRSSPSKWPGLIVHHKQIQTVPPHLQSQSYNLEYFYHSHRLSLMRRGFLLQLQSQYNTILNHDYVKNNAYRLTP